MALLHRNEELLLSAGYDGWVVLWDVRSLRGEEPYMVSRFRAHGSGVGGWGPGGLVGGGAGAEVGEGAQKEGEVEGSEKAGAGGSGRGSEVGGAGEGGVGRAGEVGRGPRASGLVMGSVLGGGRGAGGAGLVGGASTTSVGRLGRLGSGRSAGAAEGGGPLSAGPSAASLHGGASAASVGSGSTATTGVAGAARAAASPQRSISAAAAAAVLPTGDSRASTTSGTPAGVAPRDVSTAPSASNGGSGGEGGSGTAAVGRSLSANEAGRERLRAALFGPEPEILALRFDPLKKVIITAGTDKTIKVGVVRVGYGREEAVCELVQLGKQRPLRLRTDVSSCEHSVQPSGVVRQQLRVPRVPLGPHGACDVPGAGLQLPVQRIGRRHHTAVGHGAGGGGQAGQPAGGWVAGGAQMWCWGSEGCREVVGWCCIALDGDSNSGTVWAAVSLAGR